MRMCICSRTGAGYRGECRRLLRASGAWHASLRRFPHAYKVPAGKRYRLPAHTCCAPPARHPVHWVSDALRMVRCTRLQPLPHVPTAAAFMHLRLQPSLHVPTVAGAEHSGAFDRDRARRQHRQRQPQLAPHLQAWPGLPRRATAGLRTLDLRP